MDCHSSAAEITKILIAGRMPLMTARSFSARYLAPVILLTAGLNVALRAQVPVITAGAANQPPFGYIGVPFLYGITAANSPTSFDATGLPPGLSVNTSTGTVSGTPIALGSFPVTIVAANGYGYGTATITITVSSTPLILSILAGQSNFGSADGTGVNAQFNDPYGVALDASGNLYVTDVNNDTIRKISPGAIVTTLAGLAGQIGSLDGVGSAARFYHPTGIAVDSTGNVYVADTINQTIRKISPAGVVTTLAGAVGKAGSADGTGAAARFSYPFGVALDTTGNLYVADNENSTIRKISPTGVVTTFAGAAGQAGSADGTGSNACGP